jgi:beta-carotene/zeaxanthin 4-ketolase
MASPRPIQSPLWHTESRWGLTLTIVLLGAWLSTLSLLLPLSLATIPIGWLLAAIGGRTFLHTGLFILAHDAMHRNLIPQDSVLNHRIGQLCVGLYGFLSYAQCRRNHGLHHQIPAQIGDPDWHDGVHRHPLWWYWHFLRGYLSLRGFGWFTLGWSGILLLGGGGLQLPVANILLFWALPLILSSIQLFIFGTYLPHRCGTIGVAPSTSLQTPQADDRRTPVNRLWSLLSCYHFGNYHWAHHTHPTIPWYRLPQLHSTTTKS